MSKITQKDKARFFAKVSISPDCWIWTGATRGAGYGIFHLGGKQYAAHRVMFAMEHPEHEETMLHKRSCKGLRMDYILHACDNPSCVNPDHLRMGCSSDNCQDMRARNRNERQKYPPAKKGEKRGPVAVAMEHLAHCKPLEQTKDVQAQCESEA